MAPEEARLLIADEDDHFFFQIRCFQQMCQDFDSQEFELIIIFGIVSAVYIAVYSSSWHCNWSAVSVEMVFKSSFKSSQVKLTQGIN